MSLSITTADALLKRMYTKKRIAQAAYAKSKLLAICNKDESYSGTGVTVPVIYSNTMGRSADFATAQSLASSSSLKSKAFFVQAVTDYAVAKVTGTAARRSMNDEGAFMRLMKAEMDSARDQLTRSLAQKLPRSGWGAIGQIATTTNLATTTLKFSSIDDVNTIDVDAQVVFAAAEGTGNLRTATALTVTAVNRDLGTVTLSATPDSLAASIAVSDFIFLKGDREASGSPSKQCISGLEACIPYTAPTSGDSHYGVDRSIDVVRLAGVRFDCTSYTPQEACVELAGRVHRQGGVVKELAVPPHFYRSLVKDLSGQVRYVNTNAKGAEFSFRSIELIGEEGPIEVFSDPNIPANRMWALNSDYMTFYSTGPAVRIIDEDGQTWLRESSSDGFEVRWGLDGNFVISAPWNFGVGLITAPTS